jgi:hypothetical protein
VFLSSLNVALCFVLAQVKYDCSIFLESKKGKVFCWGGR